MIFGMLCLLCHTNLPAKNERNLPHGFGDRPLTTAMATRIRLRLSFWRQIQRMCDAKGCATVKLGHDARSKRLRRHVYLRVPSRDVRHFKGAVSRRMKILMTIPAWRDKMGLSQELWGPQKWFTCQNLRNFMRKVMQILAKLLFHRKRLQNSFFLITQNGDWDKWSEFSSSLLKQGPLMEDFKMNLFLSPGYKTL